MVSGSTTPEHCGAILDEALAVNGPTVIEAVIDPNEPPMPAKISPKQALHFAEALARGTPGRKRLIETVMKDKIREMI